ncbi:class I adenylate-forming enzyme family protein [Nocardioides sp.]|uniref:class I adenylate-forming enzyme family protein n=1 Tax=Nocardioides sp. TaxID=35761 RepID=UPI003565C48D
MQLLVSDIFRNAAVAVPDRLAYAVGDQGWTFRELDLISEQAARCLLDRGVRPGDHVAYRADLSLATVALFIATAKIGAVFAPIDPALSQGEAADLERLVGSDLSLSLDRSGVERLLAEASALGGVEQVPDDGMDERAAHVLFFTSGSTGAPKGIPVSHRVSMLRSHPGAQPESRGPALCPFPLFHMAAWTIALQQWQARAAVILPETFQADAICAGIAAYRAERIYCIPAIWRRVMDHVDEMRAKGAPLPDLSSIRFADTGTSATPPTLIEGLKDLLPQAQVRIFYGSTEAGPVTCLEGSALTERAGSCGLPMQGVRLRISEAGELQIRGPSVFEPESMSADAGFTADGWLRTGDLAEIDADGFVAITGRAKEVIRSGGHSVSPTEVEGVLATLPGVRDVAVVGLPDPDWGETVCAAVVAELGQAPPDLASIREGCAARLAAFKHPRRMVLVDQIPRTASTQQVRRGALVAQILEERDA